MDRAGRTFVGSTLALAALFVALVYGPDLGHGFIKDDFTWVATAARLGDRPWTAFTSDFTGTFYRPIITLTFAADRAAYGLRPFGYGVTNLLLLLAGAAAMALLLRQLGITVAAAAAAAALWLINPHGINMSVLWLSGRTSLVMTLLSCGAIAATVKACAGPAPSWRWAAAGWLLLLGAMLSKEDALLVPAIALTALWVRQVRRSQMLAAAAVMSAAAAAYLALRWQSHALTATTAPAFYQLTSAPALIAGNALGYLDRSATIFAIAALLAFLAQRQRPTLTPLGRRQLALALVWFLAGIAITVRVPVRSSLYAVFPSIGAALAFAAWLDALGAQSNAWRSRQAVVVLLGLAVLATPIYRSRNQRWVLSADVSQRTATALAASRAGLPSNGRLVFEDDDVRFASFEDALGVAATDAVHLFTGTSLEGVIVEDGAAREHEVARARLENGQVRIAVTAGR